jgi:hypothetical protein
MLIGSSRGCGCAKSSFHVWLTKLGGTRVLFGPSDFINAQARNDGYSRVVDLPGHALAQGQDVDEKFFQAQHPTTSKSDRHVSQSRGNQQERQDLCSPWEELGSFTTHHGRLQ